MSNFESTYSSDGRECPYCGHTSHVESEDYSEDSRIEECDECGKKFHAHEVFSVDHKAEPDCELNGEQHKFELVTFSSGKSAEFCETCNKCRLVKATPAAVGQGN